MISTPIVSLTEAQNTQLKQWLQMSADLQDLRCVLEKVCEMRPDFAKLVYEEALCGPLEVTRDGPSSLRIHGAEVAPVHVALDAIARESRDSAQLSSGVNGDEPQQVAGEGSRESIWMDERSILTLSNSDGADRNPTSLTSVLQPSSALTDRDCNVLGISHYGLVNKKRKLDHEPPQQLAICKLCACSYDIGRDSEQLCIFHSGELERDEEAWQEIDDFDSVSDRDYQVTSPEDYLWTCCGKKGDDLGCQQGHHLSNCMQTVYAELKHRRS